eukprot:scaffold4598_cov100-Isochrysis_galbana.AAC.4
MRWRSLRTTSTRCSPLLVPPFRPASRTGAARLHGSTPPATATHAFPAAGCCTAAKPPQPLSRVVDLAHTRRAR